MSDTVIMAYVGDLFPRCLATPCDVAAGISRYFASADLSRAPREIQEVVRTAAEWQGARDPKKPLFRPAASPAGEEEFLQAAKAAFKRFG